MLSIVLYGRPHINSEDSLCGSILSLAALGGGLDWDLGVCPAALPPAAVATFESLKGFCPDGIGLGKHRFQ